MHLALAVVLSVAIGLSLGLLGGGGSILTVPILVYVLGLDAKPAIAMSLLVVGIASLAALVPHALAQRVRFGTGGAFGLASMATAFLGGRVAHAIPSGVLLLAFAGTMLVTALAMLRGRPRAAGEPAQPRWGRVAVSGAGIGLLTGILGAGGGFLIVPALVLFCGMDIVTSVATSLFVIAMNSFAGFAGYLGTVSVDLRVAGLMSAAAVGGSLLGARWAGRVRPAALRRGFARFVLAMGVFMVGRQTSITIGAIALVIALTAAWMFPRSTPATLHHPLHHTRTGAKT